MTALGFLVGDTLEFFSEQGFWDRIWLFLLTAFIGAVVVIAPLLCIGSGSVWGGLLLVTAWPMGSYYTLRWIGDGDLVPGLFRCMSAFVTACVALIIVMAVSR